MKPPPTHRVGGLNHLTLAVADVARSLAFYVDALGMQLRARWPRGAYLDADGTWIALVLDEKLEGLPHPEYTHFAFSVTAQAFEPLCRRLEAAGASPWQVNRTEGDSFYVLDPDGHRLELHVGDLESRLAAARVAPWEGLEIT